MLPNRLVVLPLLLITFQLYSQLAHQSDSIKQVIAQQTGNDKLNSIYNLHCLHAGTHQGLTLLKQLEKEAKKQGDKKFQCVAWANMVTHYANQANLDSALFYANTGINVCREDQQYQALFDIESMIVNLYIYRGEYELAKFRIEEMSREAKILASTDGQIAACENMGIVMLITENPQQAISPLKEGIELLKNNGNRKIYIMEMYMHLVDAYLLLKDWNQVLFYSDALQKLLFDFESTKKGTKYETLSMDDFLLANQTAFAQAYTGLQQFDQARASLTKASEYAQSEMSETYYQLLNSAYTDYYNKTGDYPKALQYLDTLLPFYKANLPVEYIKFIKEKAEILENLKQFEKANLLNKEAIVLNDSLSSDKLTKEINQLRVIHQVEKMELKTKQTQIKLLAATIICLFLIFIIVLVYYQSNRLKKKNRSLYNRITEQDKLTNELQSKQNELERLQLIMKGDGIDNKEEKEDELFNQLELLMKNQQVYTIAALSRKEVADMLGTNENYLFDSIKRNMDITFTEYLNHWRLNHAREQLALNNPELTIEVIAIDSGFGSRNTFYRLFRERYGLTPVEFKRLANDVK